MSTKSVKRRVAPLEHVCILKGTSSASKNGKKKRRVAPLEHVVRPEGHVAQGNR
jgi:hypothetical protein